MIKVEVSILQDIFA